MIYSSNEFLILFPVLFLSFYLIKSNIWQNSIIFVSTGIFLSWLGLGHLLVMIVSIAIAMIALHRMVSHGARDISAPIAITLLLFNLAYFKYRIFIGGTFGIELPSIEGIEWLIPLGISFYTLQMIGAIIDLGEQPDAFKARSFPLFVMFFPQLIAGPIVKHRILVPQFDAPKSLRWNNFAIGFQCFTIGYLKKILIADPIAFMIDPIWSNPDNFSWEAILVAVVGFYLQVYADFSGYMDMGRGAARMLGFRLPINFRGPYFTVSPIEFYNRWHMTLSFWIRDYLFSPLAIAAARTVRNRKMLLPIVGGIIVLVMSLVGLWHGAAFRFVVFGLSHGLLIVAWYFIFGRRIPQQWHRWILRVLLFQAVLILTFVIFRAPSFDHMISIFGGLLQARDGAFPPINWIAVGLVSFGVLFFQFFEYNVHNRRGRWLSKFRSSGTGVLICAICVFLAFFFKGVTLQGVWMPYGEPRLYEGVETFIYFAF